MKTTAATVVIALCFACASFADEKEKEKKEAASKEAVEKRAPAGKRAAPEQKAAPEKKAEPRKKESAHSSKGKAETDSAAVAHKNYEEQRKASYEKYMAARQELSAKRAKAFAAMIQVEAELRAAERAVAEVDSAIKRNDLEWSTKEKSYRSWKERTEAQERERARYAAESKERAENDALKRAVHDLKREVDSLRRELASRREQRTEGLRAEKKKDE